MPEHATINDRIAELAGVFSQSDIARRTGVPQPSISRYLAGQRVPAEVCARFVDGLGVNAGWLLTGRGSRFVVELSDEEQDVARHLQRVLVSLTTDAEIITRISEGTGVHDLAALRDVLGRYRETHGQLDSLLRPLVDLMSSRVVQEMDLGTLDTSADYWAICDLLVDLSTGSTEPTQLDAPAFLHSMPHDHERAMAARRAVFRSNLLTQPDDFDAYGLQQYNYATSLMSFGYIEEAHRVVASLVAFHSNHSDCAAYWELHSLLGTLEIEIGSLDSGIQRLQDAIPRTRDECSALDRGSLIGALVVRGSLSLEGAIAGELSRFRDLDECFRCRSALRLLWHCVALGAGFDLQPLLEHIDGSLDETSNAMIPFSTHYCRARASAPDGVVEEYLAAIAPSGESGEPRPRPYMEQVETAVLAAHLACMTAHANAAQLLEESHRWVAEPPPGQLPRLLVRYLHHADVIRHVVPTRPQHEAMRDAARRFLEHHVGRGYLAFRHVLDED